MSTSRQMNAENLEPRNRASNEKPCPLCGQKVKSVPSHLRYGCPKAEAARGDDRPLPEVLASI